MFFLILTLIVGLLQLAAAFWSLKLIWAAKRSPFWILLTAGLFFFAIYHIIAGMDINSDLGNLHLLHFIILLELLASVLYTAGVIWIVIYFTSGKSKENSGIASESKFKTLFDHSSDEIYVIDFEENFIEVNKVICDVLGYRRDELLRMQVKDIKPDKYGDIVESLLEKLKKDGSLVFESEHISKEGKKIPVEIKSRIINYGSGTAIMSIARDISERKQTERKILNAIIETEEKDKERFARDLHDGLGTLLSSINIYLNLIKSKEANEAQKLLWMDYTKGLVDDAMLNAREIANDLRPSSINNFGLAASVKTLCDKFNAGGIISIKFEVSNIDAEELEKDLEVTLYRVINELINNTLKHASAKNIDICLSKENEILTLAYHDNGKGFDLSGVMESNTNKGMGLSNIMSRIKAVNGTCSINKNNTAGTEVFIKVNLK
jgi:PAS domain S-box-containing protein